ncbi:hypothetical protein HPB51_024902 [Rhipicephalus microplus]|uniref:Uncharacterized protein n=1 Tax=Rhipicephalus microplus TaxID=6941 RepID=A0A9J6DJX9_RHIMP|nr:hypothetical protein HPB51_024902 [Rhipicephalus microplus]
MPMGQAGGGSQGGPIVITSPPPPAPPNPPLPPYPPTPRPGIAQDVASMLMVLLMNHVRERIDGTSPDVRSQQRLRDEEVAAAAANAAVEALNKAQLPKEPMVPAWMFRELLPVGGRRSSVDLDKQKKKKKLKKRKDDGPLEPPETPPPLVLPFSVPDADTQVPPSVLVEKIPAESPEESSILKPEESPEE